MNADLERLPLAALRARFSALAAPDAAALTGPWRGAFIGPAWLRAVAPRGLALVGLRGWLGKEIAGEKGEAANLVRRGGAVERVLPMRLSEAHSLWDGRPCARLSYPRGSPAHWPWVVDELRTLDARRCSASASWTSASPGARRCPFSSRARRPRRRVDRSAAARGGAHPFPLGEQPMLFG